jgi:hypothetical protein
MSQRLIELAVRRERLVARIAAQRGELSGYLVPVKNACAVADKGVAAARYLQRHPWLVASAVAVTVAVRPRKAITWLKRGWFAWKFVRNLRQRLTGA